MRSGLWLAPLLLDRLAVVQLTPQQADDPAQWGGDGGVWGRGAAAGFREREDAACSSSRASSRRSSSSTSSSSGRGSGSSSVDSRATTGGMSPAAPPQAWQLHGPGPPSGSDIAVSRGGKSAEGGGAVVGRSGGDAACTGGSAHPAEMAEDVFLGLRLEGGRVRF